MLIYKNSSVIVDKIDDVYVLLNKDNDSIYDLNQIGYLLWSSLIDGCDLHDLCNAWEYCVDKLPHDFEQEISSYMETLKKLGMIVCDDISVSKVSVAKISAKLIRTIIKEQGYYEFKYYGSSMTSIFRENQLLFVLPLDAYSDHVNDIIAYVNETDGSFIAHRIVKITRTDDNNFEYITRGDNNNYNDSPLLSDMVLGKVYIPHILTNEKFKLCDGVTLRDEGEMALLYDFYSQKMKVVNKVGALIIDLLNGTNQFVNIVISLLNNFEDNIDLENILRDTENFIIELKDLGYIENV